MSHTESSEIMVIEPQEPLAARAKVRRPPVALRRVLAVLIGCLFAGILTISTAESASASSYTGVATVCFQQTGGGAYTGPTEMQYYWNGYWYFLQSAPGENSGCHSWLTPDNYYIRFAVNYSLGSSRWTSSSPWILARAYTNYRFPSSYLVTWTVRR